MVFSLRPLSLIMPRMMFLKIRMFDVADDGLPRVSDGETDIVELHSRCNKFLIQVGTKMKQEWTYPIPGYRSPFVLTRV